MKKRLDTTNIMNELRGQSAFFPAQKKELQEESHPTHSQETNESEVSRYHDTTIPSNHGIMVSPKKEDIIEVVRRSVRRIGKEAATHRCTLEERQALDEIEYQYKR